MRDCLRHLHGEPEVVGDIVRPALIGRQAMRPIERRVDLDSGKPAPVSHQMAAFIREGILVCLRDCPSGGPDIDATLTHVLTDIQAAGWREGRECRRPLASFELSSSRIKLLAAVPVLFDQLLGLRNTDAVLPGKVLDLVPFSAGDPATIATAAIGFVIRHSATPFTTSPVPKCAEDAERFHEALTASQISVENSERVIPRRRC